jgi:hypothetical protein
LVCHIKGRTQIEGVGEQGAEENMGLGRMGWQEAGENCLMRNCEICVLLNKAL